MTENKLTSIHDVISALKYIDELSTVNGVSHHFIEIEKVTMDGMDEIRINCNKEGLQYVALKILELAVKGFPGAHQHFDKNEMVDRCDVPVVVCLKKADW